MIHSIAWPTYQSYDAHAVPSTPRVQLVTHLVSLVIQAINRHDLFPHWQHTLCDLNNWQQHSALSADQAATAGPPAHWHHANASGHCRSNGDVSPDAARDCVGLDGAVAFHGPHVPPYEFLSRLRAVLVELCHGVYIAGQVSRALSLMDQIDGQIRQRYKHTHTRIIYKLSICLPNFSGITPSWSHYRDPLIEVASCWPVPGWDPSFAAFPRFVEWECPLLVSPLSN